MVSPDDVCQVCHDTRENHGDRMHQFSEDGQLVVKEPPKPPTVPAPKTRVEQQLDTQQLGDSFATLLEVLAEKGVLQAPDIIRILSAHR